MWFGARTITQLIEHQRYADAYRELSAMVDLVHCYGDFYEWYTLSGSPRGAAGFKGAVGQLYLAIQALGSWAKSE